MQEMRFAGQLQVESDPGPGLKVVVEVKPDRMVITCGADELGHWPLRDVSLSPLDRDRFALTIRQDRTVFTPDDPVRFSYDAVPLVGPNPAGSRALGRIWSWLTEPDLPDLDEPEPYEASRPTLTIVQERPPTDELVIDLATPDPQPPALSTCFGRRRDGQRCRSRILLPSGYCAVHDPNHRPRPRTSGQNPSHRLRDLRSRLVKVLNGVETGDIDPDTGMAVAALVQAMCAVEQLSRQNLPLTRPPDRSL